MKRVLIIVAVVLALAVALRIVLQPRQTPEVRKAMTHIDIVSYHAGLALFREDMGRYPSQAEGLAILVEKEPRPGSGLRLGGYLLDLRNDPWGNPYRYCVLSDAPSDAQVIVCSYGADGVAGGVDEASDYCASHEGEQEAVGMKC